MATQIPTEEIRVIALHLDELSKEDEKYQLKQRSTFISRFISASVVIIREIMNVFS